MPWAGLVHLEDACDHVLHAWGGRRFGCDLWWFGWGGPYYSMVARRDAAYYYKGGIR